MSNIPTDLRYAATHEWVRPEGDGVFTVGISEHAQGLLGDMVFVDLPDVGDAVSTGDDVCVAESVKAAFDVYAPISGEIVALTKTQKILHQLTLTRTATVGYSKLKLTMRQK